MPSLHQLETERERLINALTHLSDMRPGSLVSRYRKCGKPNCHCTQPASQAHGPSWSLTRSVDGKTVTKVIPAGSAVEQTKAQIAEYRHFRKLVQEFVELNVQICDQKLKLKQGSASAASKKNGARRRTRRRRRSGS